MDGIFKGMDWSEDLKDRKRVRAMEDEEHKWRREQQDWAREDQAAQRDERAFTKSERERLKTFRENDEAAWNATVAQMKGTGPNGPRAAPRRDPLDMPDVAGGQRLGFGIPTREEVEAAQPGVTRPAQPAAPQGVGRLGLSTMNARPPAAAGQPPQVMSEAPTRGPDPAAPAPVVIRRPVGGMSIRDLASQLGPDIVGYQQGHVDPRLARAAGVGQPQAAGIMSEGPTRPADPQVPPPVSIAMRPGEMSLRDAYASLGADGVGYGAGRVDPRLARAATAQEAKKSLEVVAAPGLPEDVILQADGSIIGADSGRAYDRNAIAPLIEAARRPATQRDPSARGKLAYAEAATRAQLEDMARRQALSPKFAQAEEQAKAQIAEEYARRQARQSQPPQQPPQDAAGRRAQSIADAVGSIPGRIGRAIGIYPGAMQDFAAMGGDVTGRAQQAAGVVAAAAQAPEAGAALMRAGATNRAAPRAPAAAQAGQPPADGPAPQPAQLSFGAQPAAAAPAGTGAAAAEKSARTTFGMGVIGEGMPVKTTAARRDRAATDGLRMFNEEEMPAIVERFLRTGRVKEAQAFQEWSQQQGVQKGIKSYMAATHAMMLRDTDAAERHLTEVFNNADYYDDGFSIPKGGLEIIEGDGGKIRRAKLTMRNDRTGETVTQEYSGEDLMMMAYSALDPVAAFEAGWAAISDPKKSATSDSLKDLQTATSILKSAIEAEAKSRGEEYPDAEAILEGYSAAEVIEAAQVLQANPGADIFSLLGDVPVATFE
ncbi:hypothetical protein V6Z72_13345 [Cereibacter sphaeroides]|uniref:hypothetical protein n=1 Tax=Cereibacter sphaeroides TaxID=1063 RepID=UPI0039909450